MPRYQTGHPIWRVMKHQHRSRAWLAERTGYSRSHIDGVAAGQWPASAEFRRKCSFAIDLPEDMLFLADEPAARTSDVA